MLELAMLGVIVNISLLWKCAHPMVLCLLLVILATLVAVASSLLVSKWVGYAIILVFLGGMMVIFIYITSLAGSDKFFLRNSLNMNIFTVLATLFIPVLLNLSKHSKKEFFMTHIFQMNSPVLWFSIFFLLATLFIVVKLSESFKGALVKFS